MTRHPLLTFHTPTGKAAAPTRRPAHNVPSPPPNLARAIPLLSLTLTAWIFSNAAPLHAAPPAPFLRSELIFPAEHWHNHSSSIVETRRGDLIVCWFHGSGERKADDVIVEGARLRRGSKTWSPRFLLADTPGYPDTNCTLFFDPSDRLWLVWPTILANLWESALLKYRISSDYERPGPPRWSQDGVLHITPGPEFAEAIQRWIPEARQRLADPAIPASDREEVERYLAVMQERAADKLYHRLGWMTRSHAVILNGSRLLLPLYHDGFSCSLIAVSDDLGASWKTSAPLLGGGNIQPSIAQRQDGSLVAYMRDNGPPPARLMQSESRDGGLTWSPVTDTAIPNPGSGADLIHLRDGRWLFVGNDTESGRHRLVVQLSSDDGRTWPHRRYLENDPPGPLAGRYHYPSAIQARDGSIHITYSHHLSGERKDLPLDAHGQPARSSIKHAHFNLDWILAESPAAIPRGPH